MGMSNRLIKYLRRRLYTGKKRPNFRLVSGWVFIVVGIIGLFLPILQGVLFIIIGISLLSSHYPFFNRMTLRLKSYRFYRKVSNHVWFKAMLRQNPEVEEPSSAQSLPANDNCPAADKNAANGDSEV